MLVCMCRSLTAKGQAVDAAGGFAPKAAAMKKLVRFRGLLIVVKGKPEHF